MMRKRWRAKKKADSYISATVDGDKIIIESYGDEHDIMLSLVAAVKNMIDESDTPDSATVAFFELLVDALDGCKIG